MNALLLIAAHEGRRLSRSPLAWTCLAVVQLIHALVFWLLLAEFAAEGSPDGRIGVAELVGGGLFGFASLVLLLLVPLLAMRSIAEERSQGSLELLLAAPLSLAQLILGKYLGLLGFLALLLAFTVAMPLSLLLGTPLDLGLIMSAALGLFLLAALFAAAGLLASSLAPQPAVAALLGFGLLLLLWLLELAATQPGLPGALAGALSPLAHFETLRRGLIDSHDLAYFLLFSGALLRLACGWLDAERRSQGRGALALNLLLWLSLLVLIGLATERHRFQVDVSAAARNSLSPASEQILDALPGPISARVFLSPDAELRRQIGARLSPYQRHKADFSVAFVDPATRPQEVRDLGISAAGELRLEYQGRQESLAEISEASVSAALQRLARADAARPLILQGHGERAATDEGPAGLSQWVAALEKLGLPPRRLNLALDGPIPADTGVLILAAPRQALLPGEIRQLLDYLAAGGHLLWLSDPDSAVPGALADALDLLPLKGTVIMQDHELLGLGHPGLALVGRYPEHPLSHGLDALSVFPLAGGLLASPGSDWQRTPLLQSLERAWLETGPLTAGAVDFDPAQDQKGPILLGLAQTRATPQGDEQRVVVIADSDFLSNQYLDQLGNRRLSLNLLQWLGTAEAPITIEVPASPDTRLRLSPWQIRLLGAGHAVLLPLAFLLAGLAQWRRRSRRR